MTTAELIASAADLVPLNDNDSPVNSHDGDDSASDVSVNTETGEDDDVDVSSTYHQHTLHGGRLMHQGDTQAKQWTAWNARVDAVICSGGSTAGDGTVMHPTLRHFEEV